MKTLRLKLWLTAGIICLILLPPATAIGFPVTIMDAGGHPVVFEQAPQRAVSLVPSATEIVVALGARDALTGITYHSADVMAGCDVVLVGGFGSPDLKTIEAIQPDVILISGHHQKIRERFADSKACVLITCETDSIVDSLEDIRQLGKLFGKDSEAETIIADIQDDLSLVARKIVDIPPKERRRVIRLMGRDEIMTPGSDSVQQEMIRAAGGITHNFNKNGGVITVQSRAWKKFNPQFIYGCGGDRLAAEKFLTTPDWQDVDAVTGHHIAYFPCNLTCRAATNTGRFVSWLAASIYTDAFSDIDSLVDPESILQETPLETDTAAPDYVKARSRVNSRIYDFVNKSLVIDFNTPMTVLSSLEGMKTGVTCIGNHYMPPPCWPISHKIGLPAFRGHVLDLLGRNRQQAAFLFTGADMDHLAVGQAEFRDLRVWAYVTAGVAGNAVRMSQSTGFYYEPGTINILLLTNMKLSDRALTRSIITVTEAKTAALLDLDIRVSGDQGAWRATGTGTDNIIVVQGAGMLLDTAGGHAKLGELIGRAVHDGVTLAIRKQNRLVPSRDVFQRLRERGISVADLISSVRCDCIAENTDAIGKIEGILLDSRYAGFIELALAINDDYEKGLITDLTAFDRLAQQISEEISGQPIVEIRDLIEADQIPFVIRSAFNAILTGVDKRTE